ncbi:hypothetical protein FAES_5433 [Fibrella aestuarina BUZ 2]|uniref:Uncharacterized protein n=1 Tax=Fibrella aestuarina BUZ 2 TaxID=1166018 RepID=I0KH29_9BACT|nr:hypothetical protein FAES_5433 [Fibrella aestuarina BUZ 2]
MTMIVVYPAGAGRYSNARLQPELSAIHGQVRCAAAAQAYLANKPYCTERTWAAMAR